MPRHPRWTAHFRIVAPLAAAAASLALLGGCGDAKEEVAPAAASATPGVVASDGWVRATVGTDDPSMTGAFMQIRNDTDRQVTLTGASSDVAGVAEIHEMVMKDGAMVMQPVDGGLEIPAGKLAVLQPGGHHVMLMMLEKELAAGDEVALTLEFADGTTLDLTLPVKEFAEDGGHYHPSPSATPST